MTFDTRFDPPWMSIARAEIGTAEIPGPGANPRIVEYDKYTTLKATSDETAWCSAFACFVVDGAGMESTHSAAALSWKDWGIALSFPLVGAIAVFDHGGGKGHVTFVAGRPKGLKGIVGLGGNQNNMVKYSVYGLERLVAIRWPDVPVLDLASNQGESTA